MKKLFSKWFYLISIGAIYFTIISCKNNSSDKKAILKKDTIPEIILWQPPDANLIPSNNTGDLIRYGKELITHTSVYLGPKGTVAQISNGMNCQNCHLNAGTKNWGNNFSGVYAIYPKFKERSGSIENIYTKINDCFQRSLNGRSLDTAGREMKAIYAYIKWLGTDVKKGVKPPGSGIRELPFPDAAADTSYGRIIFNSKCVRCHQKNGEGILSDDSLSYKYPPLWGDHSFNIGASLFRITKIAGFVKDNMPFDDGVKTPMLTDEEAWDVAAFVCSQPRPKKNIKKDWPDIATKPVDNPFGPYADAFSESQHKYGPFAPIKNAKDAIKKK